MSNFTILNLEITKRCNLNCKHCAAECGTTHLQSNLSKNELDLSTINKLIDDASEMKCKILIIAGGEPLLSDKLWDVLDKAYEKKLMVSILSNGLLITESICMKLSKYPNLKFIRLSLDFSDNMNMKHFRGIPNIVSKVKVSLGLLNKYKIPCGIGMTVLAENISEIQPVAEIAEKSGAHFFRAIPVVPIGMAHSLEIDNDFYVQTLKEMIKLFKKYPQPNFNYESKNHIYDILTACPAGNDSISISSEGNIGFCPISGYLPNLGTLKNNSLITLYDKIKKEKENINHKISTESLDCSRCSFFNICNGGCLVERFSRNSYIKQPICIKSVLTKLTNNDDSDSFNNYLNTCSFICKSLKQTNFNVCFRALPLWTIYFNK